ncbi:cellulose biosynthesis cyclic di-GMP-binding regulatory protein BcsB [Telmatospirillum siberiense]|uniref:cellulose biosynthesis cyclic di-GMP-binding regulatory protein BcsB n=1 Tax=Telmatospirillum siberiense TaxID=382514 RepID=UPI001304019F|nr:cellulose biosynthesis cyclic di-GMP-binding regulatory protein BcsB [Telmatospirillum siberiense]
MNTGDQDLPLRALGYEDGVILSPKNKSITLFFPVENWRSKPRRVDIRLDVEFSSLLDNYSSLTVLAGNVPVATIAKSNGTSQRVSVPLPANIITGPYLRVTLAGDAALSRVNCFDSFRESAWIVVHPGSSLHLTDYALSISPLPWDVWNSLTGTVRLGLPARPSSDEYAAGLRVAADMVRRGRQIAIVDAASDDADIVIDGSDPAQPRLRQSPKRPDSQLVIASEAQARALTVSSEFFAGSEPPPIFTVTQSPPLDGDRISLERLGLTTETRTFSSSTRIDIPLDMMVMPRGKIPTELVLFGQGSVLPKNELIILDYLVNDTLVKSEEMSDAILLNGLTLPIPREMLHRNNRISLEVRRLSSKSACQSEEPGLFQIRKGSYFAISKQDWQGNDIVDWVVNRDSSLNVVLSGSPTVDRASVPLVARLIADGVSPSSAIQVAFADQARPLGEKFIYVGDKVPPGALRFPVSLDRGRVAFTLGLTGEAISFTPGGRLTLVQRGKKQAYDGLWVYPGSSESMSGTQALGGAGDIGLYSGIASPRALQSSQREFSIEYAQAEDLAAFLNRYRVILLIGAWLTLTVIILYLVLRSRRSGAARKS